MATCKWISLVIAAVAICSSQAHPYSSSSEEDECLQPPEVKYYENSDYDDPCQRLGDAIIRYREYLRWATLTSGDPEVYDRYHRLILRGSGIDIDQDQLLLDLACQLEDVHSVEEVVNLLNLTIHEDTIVSEYNRGLLTLARVDGFHGIRMYMESQLTVVNLLRELAGKGEGRLNHSDIIAAITPDVLSGILHQLEDEFGSGYLFYLRMRPYNDALVGVDHHLLANAILDGDVSCRLGVSNEIGRTFSGFPLYLINSGLSRELLDLIFDAFVAADQMGLFNLRN